MVTNLNKKGLERKLLAQEMLASRMNKMGWALPRGRRRWCFLTLMWASSLSNEQCWSGCEYSESLVEVSLEHWPFHLFHAITLEHSGSSKIAILKSIHCCPKPFVSLIGRLVACSARIASGQTHKQTDQSTITITADAR